MNWVLLGLHERLITRSRLLALVVLLSSWPIVAQADDHFVFSWEGADVGPCHSVRVDQKRVPEPQACPTGMVQAGYGATTAFCPNFHACSCTNWMDCEHAKEFPWGCSASTPWLPFKVRRCVPKGTTVNIDPGTNLVPVPGVSAPRTGLTFLSLSSFDRKLKDGDLVNVVIADRNVPNDRVNIRLRTRAGMWFKGLEGHSDSGVVKLEAENGGMSGVFSLSRTDLPNVWIVFVKAKFLGVHTPMYELPGTALTPLLGKNVIFDWIAD